MYWVNSRRLKSITAVSGIHDTMSFTYDSDGLHLTKTVGSGNSAVEHRYTWQGGKLISETWDGKKIEYFYGPEGSIDGFNYKASAGGVRNSYYYVKNLQGDVVKIINKDGELKATYTYDHFSTAMSTTNSFICDKVDIQFLCFTVRHIIDEKAQPRKKLGCAFITYRDAGRAKNKYTLLIIR